MAFCQGFLINFWIIGIDIFYNLGIHTNLGNNDGKIIIIRILLCQLKMSYENILLIALILRSCRKIIRPIIIPERSKRVSLKRPVLPLTNS